MCRVGLGDRGGIGERQDDGPLGWREPIDHRADHGLVERARDTGRPHQDRRPPRVDDVHEVAARHARHGRHRERALLRIEVHPALVDEPVRVDEGDVLVHLAVRHARRTERHPEQPGDADARGSGAHDDHADLLERLVRTARSGEHTGQDDGGRALDVIVEGRQAVPVPIEESEGIVLLEVLELDEAAGPHLVHAGDECLHQLVVRLTPKARLSVSEVERVGQQRRVVGADVERDRQGEARMDAACRGVQGELADGDGHTAGTLVAQAQDALVVRDHDEPNVGERALAQHARDASDIVWGDPCAPGPPDDVAVLLAGASHGRRVHDGQEFGEVLRQ